MACLRWGRPPLLPPTHAPFARGLRAGIAVPRLESLRCVRTDALASTSRTCAIGPARSRRGRGPRINRL
jgi:hypothetical protein